jgi:hypothetical protein
MLQHVSVTHYFLWMNDSPLYGHVGICLSIHPLRGIWAVSNLHTRYSAVENMCIQVLACLVLILSGVYLGVELQGHTLIPQLAF